MPRAAWLLFALMLSASLAPLAAPTHNTGHVRITSDAGFSSALWDGSGTQADPYTPRFSSLTARDGYGIELSGTQAHVNLTGLTITGGGTSSDAIRLYSVRNVTVHGSTLETNRYGVHVRSSSEVDLVGNTVKTSQVGVFLESSRDVELRDNKLSLNERDVELKLSTQNTLTRNNLSVATGQFGLYFDDNASYDNDIDPTNVVNAIPVRWYTGLEGEPDDPIVIEDVTVDLPRMTNVAQIMVHNSSYVRLERPVAKAGYAAGIHLHRTAVVELDDPTTDGNGASGILLELANDTTITGASSRNNTLHGLSLQSTRDTLVDGAVVTGNRGIGARVVASARDTTLRGLTLTSNAGGGVLADRAQGLTLDESTLTSNGAIAVSLETTSGVEATDNLVGGAGTTAFLVARSSGHFGDNAVTGHTTGFSFVAATGSNLTGNEVTLPARGTGFAFDGPQSYDNELAPTNLVNGTAVRWYTRVTGALTLDDLRVEQAGITNVGQIVLYRTRNVTLSEPVARNGSANGIVLYLANDTHVEEATVADNAAAGVLATQSLRLELTGSTIERSGGDGVKLVSSTAAFLENNVVTDGRARGVVAELSSAPTLRGNGIARNVGIGIHLDRVGPGGAAADHNVLEENLGGGIVAASATVGTLHANTLDSNGPDGIAFATVAVGARIDANTIVNHTRGIRLGGAVGTEVTANEITLSGPTHVGVHFSDEASYDVTMPPTNLVNGTPVRWYNGTSGVTIEAPEVELRGITNVAQIMLNKVTDVTVTGALATNGTARGIYVLRSTGVTIDGANASANAAEGALVKLSGDTRITGSTFERNGAAGIALESAPSPGARLENLTVERNANGITATSSAVALVHAVNVTGNGARGLSFTGSSRANVSAANVTNHTRAIHLQNSHSVAFADNEVTLERDQTAWWFEDETSYNNTIDESNSVNGTPMRWYAHREGLDLDDARADVRGMTNVAQIMLYRSGGARVDGAYAANGTARGIYVFASDDVVVQDSEARSNAGDGFQMNRSARLSVDGLVARNNGGDGADLVGTGSATLDDGTFANNTGAGVRLGDVLPTVRGSWFQRNGQGGVVLERSQGGLIEDNELVDETVVGIALRNSTAAPRVEGNRITNATQGISFLLSEFTTAEDNEITKSALQTGFHFADERSYNNVVDTSNTVNDAPVHWYTTLAGTEADPIVLDDVRSEVRGITNVAQVMLYRSAYVSLPDVVATNGTARGVYLYRSSSIALDGANVSDNALYGVHLQSTQSSSLTGIGAQGSGTGIRLNDSHNNVVHDVNASGASVGVALDALSRDDRVDEIETTGTAPGVSDPSWTGATLRGNNLVLDGGATKRVKVGNALTFNGTMATYRLEASRIVSQTVSFGDGTSDETSAAPAPFRPTHTYASAGTYVANLSAATADGLTLRDSVLVEVVPPLSAPRALTAVPGGRNVTLTWSAPASDGASTITKYRIFRGTNATVVPFLGEISGTTTTFLDTGLANGATYTYAVAAVNADGEGPKATATAVPVSTPGAPVSLVATARPGAAFLTWLPPSDAGGLAIRGYEILRASNGSALTVVDDVRNVTNATVEDLTNGYTYTFAVRATTAAGEGLLSANATVTPVGPASAPLRVQALPGDASATIIWSAPADNGGTNLTGYRIWRGASNDSLVALPVALAVNASRYRDSGLSNGATYSYAVTATNAVGDGTRSAVATVVPAALDALRPVVYDRAPAGDEVLAQSPTTVRAQYVDNEGVVLESVRVYLDGAQVGAQLAEDGFAYAVPQVLDAGLHTVRVVLRDPRGNEADETWSFRILGDEDKVARYEFTEHALLPARAEPGANVTARVHVRNVGYATGELTVLLLLGERVLGSEALALAVGEAREVLIPFEAPSVIGEHILTLADVPLALAVGAAQEADEEPEPPPIDEGNETEERPAGPTRDPNVTPREPVVETPFPGAALVLAVVAILALRRRKA